METTRSLRGVLRPMSLRLALTCPLLAGLLAPCYYPDFRPTTQVNLPVIFEVEQADYWCGEASVAMWARYQNYRAATQGDVYQWVWTHLPTEIRIDIGTISPLGLAAAASYYTGLNIQAVTHAEASVAIAEQRMALEIREPTIVIGNSGFHAFLLIGASWHQLNNLQPYADYVWYHNPDGIINVRDTLAHWMVTTDICDGGSCYTNVVASEAGAPTGPLSEFDAWGGTYYGDPTPPSCCQGCECGLNRLTAGQRLQGTQYRLSPNDLFRLVYQSDGNLVFYRQGGGALWSSKTNGKTVGRAEMQSDGNFVIYSASGTALWSSHTAGHPGAYLLVTNDGQARVLSSTNATLWVQPTTPPTSPTGRWKSDGHGGCYWDANDSGSNQCTPPTGRWKSDGQGGCYWDPNDSGLDQCTPSVASGSMSLPRRVLYTLTRLFSTPQRWRGSRSWGYSNARARTQEPRMQIDPLDDPLPLSVAQGQAPYPYASTRREIIENLRAGVEQTRMHLAPGSEGLRPELLGRRVGSIEWVESLSNHPDYYLISIRGDRGQHYAMASVGADGLLLSVALLTDPLRHPTITVDAAKRQVWDRLSRVPTKIRRVHMFSTATSTDFETLFEMSDDQGVVYVSDAGKIFEPAEGGTHVFADRRGIRRRLSAIGE